MDDRQIISLFFERSEQAIEALSAKYGALMKKMALSRVKLCILQMNIKNLNYMKLFIERK